MIKPWTEWKISVLNNYPLRSSHLMPIFHIRISHVEVWETLQWSQLSHFCKDRLFLKYIGYVVWFFFPIFKYQLHLHKLLWFKKYIHTYTLLLKSNLLDVSKYANCIPEQDENFAVKSYWMNWSRSKLLPNIKKHVYIWQRQSPLYKLEWSFLQNALTYRLRRIHIRVVFCIMATVRSQHYFKYLVWFNYSIFYK